MNMSCIIRDSDDEGGSDGTIEESPAKAVSIQKSLEVTGKIVTSSAMIEKLGTSSTEKIMRELESAHAALIEQTPFKTNQSPIETPSMAPSLPNKKGPPKRASTGDAMKINPTNASSRRSKSRRASSMEPPPVRSSPVRVSMRKQGQALTSGGGGGVEFDWAIPHSSQEHNTAPAATDEARTQPFTTQGNITQDDAAIFDQFIIMPASTNEPSPDDTIMNTSGADPIEVASLEPSASQHAIFDAHVQQDSYLDDHMIQEDGQQVVIDQADVDRRREEVHAVKDDFVKQTTSSIVANLPATADVDPPKSRKRKAAATDEESLGTAELTPDELIGLPKEMYVPRPSRSRGSRKLPDQGVDLNTHTNKTTKAKPKRRKTTGWVLSSGTSQLRELGYSSSQAETALWEADGKVDLAIENLLKKKGTHSVTLDVLQEEDEEDELSVFPKPSTTESDVITVQTSKKKGLEDNGTNETTLTAPMDIDNGDDARVVIIVNENNVDEAVAKKSMSKIPTNKAEKQASQQQQVEEPQVKKKGRCRPQKIVEPKPAPSVEESEVSDDDHEDNSCAPLQETTPNKACPPPAVEQESVVLITPEAKKVDKSSSVKRHSPLTFGRVPLKVGLSRRTRVEPLLRIIRK